MAYKKGLTSSSESALDFNQVIFNHIDRMMSCKDDIEYVKMVESFTDLLWYYARNDEVIAKKMKKLNIRPTKVNPYKEGTDITELVGKARMKFRVMMECIHTTGSILPVRKIEGILDENVIDAVHAATGQLDE